MLTKQLKKQLAINVQHVINIMQITIKFSHFFMTLIPIVLFTSCCGRWSGVGYYPPEISINKLGLIKVPLQKSEKLPYKGFQFPDYYHNPYECFLKEMEDSEKLYTKYFHSYSNFAYIGTFKKQQYIFEIDSYFINIYKLKENKVDRKIREIIIWRYGLLLRVFQINFKNKPYLVLYIDQQATSHSSTFFILDENFETVYEEHLLGAIEIGYGYSKKYKNYIILKSENFWFPNGLDNPKVKINGNWLYYLNTSL